ncbi:MAG TPA: cell division protein FtsA [bacterium]|nr:cell division protein FtsA [bacterium]
MSKNESIITALDVGTSKVTTLVASRNAAGRIQFIGKGVARNPDGMINGNVVNMEATTRAINESVTEADKICDVRIRSVLLGLSGEHISSLNSHGVFTVRGREVAQSDIDRVVEQSKNISLSGERRIVGTEMGEFVVDEQSGIKNPRGMAGRRLEVKTHVVTASVAMIQNLVRSVTDAGLQVDEILVNGIASAESVLQEDEKQLGVALVDIGDGTADIVVYKQGALVYTAVVPMGGRYITRDISIALRMPPAEAERVKCRFGCAEPKSVSPDEEIEVSCIGDEEKKIIKAQFVAEVITPRVEEIMVNIRKKINEDIKDSFISSGIVLTGGTANLRYIKNIAEDVLGLPVRIGRPAISDDGMGFAELLRDPSFASAVGMAYYHGRRGGVKNGSSHGGLFGWLGRVMEKFFQ